jgi:hypothetical protein
VGQKWSIGHYPMADVVILDAFWQGRNFLHMYNNGVIMTAIFVQRKGRKE